jgi:transcription initiation factor TFIIIB Brf1 subunit/transcription initiation factor TFIIB
MNRLGLLVFEPSLEPSPVQPPQPTFLCPPGDHRPVRDQSTLDTYCFECGLVIESSPAIEDEPAENYWARAPVHGIKPFLSDRKPGGSTLLFNMVAARLKKVERSGAFKNRLISKGMARAEKWEVRARPDRLSAVSVRILATVRESLAYRPFIVPPAALRETQTILERVSRHILLPGFTQEDKVAAALFTVLRSSRWKIAVPMSEITGPISGDESRAIKIHYRISRIVGVPRWLPKPVDFLRYFEPRLGLLPKERRTLVEWLEDPDIITDFIGSSPVGIVAGGSWLLLRRRPLVHGKKVPTEQTQSFISKKLGITEVSIRTNSKELERELREAGRW